MKNGFDIAYVLREEYAYEYDLLPKIDDQVPLLGLVMPNDREGDLGLSPIHNRIRQYRIYEIQKMYGLSLKEFLASPRNLVEFMISESSAEIADLLKQSKEGDKDDNLNKLASSLDGNAGILGNARIPNYES